jgi:hypothetical protein
MIRYILAWIGRPGRHARCRQQSLIELVLCADYGMREDGTMGW